MTMPCRAASPGSNRCFNLCQALKPSSSLKIFLSDPPQQPPKVGVLLHHVAVLRLPRVSSEIVNGVRLLVDLGQYLLLSQGHCVHVIGNFQLLHSSALSVKFLGIMLFCGK